MPGKRSYDDPCGVARALDVVGERWALLIIRELLHGPKRFTDLHAGLPSVSQNVLSQRLRELENSGVLRRRKLEPPASVWVYELTERGQALEPVLLELARWGSRVPMTSTAELSVDAAMLALRTTFDPARAARLRSQLELRLGVDRWCADVAGTTLRLRRGTAPAPEATVRTDVATLRALVFGGRELDEAIASAAVSVDGDHDVVRRFLALFPRPVPEPS